MHPNGSPDSFDPGPSGIAPANPADFQRVREVFDSALELPEPERASYIVAACGSEPVVFAEVQRMLGADSKSFPLLDRIPQPSARLQVGDKVAGQFVVEGLLGRGGMGEVYRCRDTTLGRTVALKVLPERIAHNSDALARLRREAQLLASLNHPNIAVIHSTEEVNALHALVLEFIEGPTLADLIAGGSLPIEQALSIARQIADALETAHETGIIHRDLKPANVKVRPDGSVKVLDFGLARGRADVGTTGHGCPGETSDPVLTDGNALLGTAAYMSPEQVRAEQVDRRSDIWAFGAVLSEMLSGQAVFTGGSTSDILTAVLQQQIDFSGLPSATPAAVLKLIRRSLERDVRRRLRDIGEARIVLEDAIACSETAIRNPGRRRMIAAVLAAALTFAGSFFLIRQEPTKNAATRLSILLPDGHTLFANRSSMTVSPDGRRIVYASAGGLHLRELSALNFSTIRGTERYFNVTEPAFSPDGRWIAFHTGSDQTIRRIPVEGGTALKVCDALYPSSLVWAKEGILYVEPGNADIAVNRTESPSPRDGIMLVPPDGGTTKHLVRARNREVFYGPQLLPGGRRVLFTVAESDAQDAWENAQIVVQDLASGERTTILRGGTDARYVPTGHLVYAVAGNLIAVPLDVRRLKLKGLAVPVIQGVMRAAPESTGRAHYSFAANGTLLYLPGPVSPSKEIIITDRKGTRERLPLPPAMYETPRVSPNGDQIAFGITEGAKSSIFVYNLSGQTTMRRLTFDGNSRLPVWSSDGTRIAYQSDRDGDRAIYRQRADGSGAVTRLTTAAKDEAHEPEAWSPGDETLLFSIKRGSSTRLSSTFHSGWVGLSALSLRDGQIHAFSDVRSSTPTGATFSPDGKWVAYATTVPYTPNSLETRGRTTISIRPFPPTGARYELAHDGKPNHPQWSRDGKELFFVPGPGQFKSVPVSVRPRFSFGRAVSVPPASSNANTLKPRTYDVMPDGRFVGVFPSSDSNERPRGEIMIVLNWFSELQARVPELR